MSSFKNKQQKPIRGTNLHLATISVGLRQQCHDDSRYVFVRKCLWNCFADAIGKGMYPGGCCTGSACYATTCILVKSHQNHRSTKFFFLFSSAAPWWQDLVTYNLAGQFSYHNTKTNPQRSPLVQTKAQILRLLRFTGQKLYIGSFLLFTLVHPNNTNVIFILGNLYICKTFSLIYKQHCGR